MLLFLIFYTFFFFSCKPATFVEFRNDLYQKLIKKLFFKSVFHLNQMKKNRLEVIPFKRFQG